MICSAPYRFPGSLLLVSGLVRRTYREDLIVMGVEPTRDCSAAHYVLEDAGSLGTVRRPVEALVV